MYARLERFCDATGLTHPLNPPLLAGEDNLSPKRYTLRHRQQDTPDLGGIGNRGRGRELQV